MADVMGDAVVSGETSGDNVRASWPFSLHTLRSNLSHCAAEGREAVIGAFLWCTDHKHPVHREEFARRVGYAPNTVYKVCAGKYRAPDGSQLDVPADLVRSIKQFLAIEQERFVGDKNEFVMTPTAKRIWTACDLARESQTPVFIYGRSHIGKTWAFEAYARENNHGRTAYCRMKAAAGLGGMVRRMATSVGVSPDSNTASLTDRIKRACTPDMLLILDELHLLAYTYRRASFFACLEVIREIYDEVRCGMILCGTKLLSAEMQKGAGGELEQLMRRGVHRCALPEMPTKGDLTAILKRSGLEFPARQEAVNVQGVEDKPYDILRQLSKEAGLLAVTERLRYGRKLAARRKETLSWEHFVEAHLTIAAQATADTSWN
jgi:DNA transposition AAA+ family ATPase